MGTLTFVCTATKKAIDPGIHTDPQTFVMVRTLTVQMRCPHCRREHAFNVADGRLANAA
jgi:cytochrome c-type biogenesis protein CcmH/NrfF